MSQVENKGWGPDEVAEYLKEHLAHPNLILHVPTTFADRTRKGFNPGIIINGGSEERAEWIRSYLSYVPHATVGVSLSSDLRYSHTRGQATLALKLSSDMQERSLQMAVIEKLLPSIQAIFNIPSNFSSRDARAIIDNAVSAGIKASRYANNVGWSAYVNDLSISTRAPEIVAQRMAEIENVHASNEEKLAMISGILPPQIPMEGISCVQRADGRIDRATSEETNALAQAYRAACQARQDALPVPPADRYYSYAQKTIIEAPAGTMMQALKQNRGQDIGPGTGYDTEGGTYFQLTATKYRQLCSRDIRGMV